MKEQKKYRITIVENETSKVIVNADTDAIIGAIDEGKSTRVLSVVSCDSVVLAATATGALCAARESIAKLPKPIKKQIEKLGKTSN